MICTIEKVIRNQKLDEEGKPKRISLDLILSKQRGTRKKKPNHPYFEAQVKLKAYLRMEEN